MECGNVGGWIDLYGGGGELVMMVSMVIFSGLGALDGWMDTP